MKKDLLHTPEGVRDIYNGECARKLVLVDKLHDVCKLYGYNDIQTPTFEFFDVFNKERGSVSSHEMFKFFDRYNNTLVLRPDMTPAIARTAAKYFTEDDMPLKLCYSGNTFINVSKYYQGKLKENTSVGCELIGDDSIDADFEIISMVIDCMKNIGIEEFQVEIGNVMYFKGLLKQAGISGETEEMLVNLILKKSYFGVEDLLDSLNIDKHLSKVLLELPQLFGSVEVLDKARKLTDNKDCLAAIDRLSELYELLKVTGYDKYISFDLGSLNNHGYYTGIVFHAYTFGTGEPVADGGRYDQLVGQFGSDKPAIGFSIPVDALMASIYHQQIKIPVDTNGILVVYDKSNLINSVAFADKLRKNNLRVNMIDSDNHKNTEDYLTYAANSQLKYVVFFNDSDLNDSNKLDTYNVNTNEKTQITLECILGGKLS